MQNSEGFDQANSPITTMDLFIAAINSIFGTYIESLERDLSNKGYETIILVASITWISSPPIILALLFLKEFQMPEDPFFYFIWFSLALLTVIQFYLYIVGMTRTKFFSAHIFSNLAFVPTIIYAVIFLNEPLNIAQAISVTAGLVGAIMFFDWQKLSKASLSSNAGLLMVLLSVFLGPLESILYKEATLHTISYSQFLTGRVTMDFVSYSIFFLLCFTFWYKKNPLPQIVSFSLCAPATLFIICSTVFHLVDSYLFFKMQVVLLSVLGIISIPMGYLIGRKKYQEQLSIRHVLGAILIVCAVMFFVTAGKYI